MKGISIALLTLIILPISAYAEVLQDTFPSVYREITINVGDQIRVNNTATISYQVTGDGFGSGSVPPAGSVLFTFNRIGEFVFSDHFNPSLKGKMIVIDPTAPRVIVDQSVKTSEGFIYISGSNFIESNPLDVTITAPDGVTNLTAQTTSAGIFSIPFQITKSMPNGQYNIVAQNGGKVDDVTFILSIAEEAPPIMEQPQTQQPTVIAQATHTPTTKTITISNTTVANSTSSSVCSNQNTVLLQAIKAQLDIIQDLLEAILAAT